MIDLIGQKPLTPIDLGALRGPHGLSFVQGKVWFTAEAAKAIGSYDPASGKIDWIMGTGQNRTHMVYVFPDAKRILTTNVNSATVTILDETEGSARIPAGAAPGSAGQPGSGERSPSAQPHGPPPASPGGNWNETVIPVGRGSEGFDVSPNGMEAWVANAQDGTISVIDLAAKRVVATLAANVPRCQPPQVHSRWQAGVRYARFSPRDPQRRHTQRSQAPDERPRLGWHPDSARRRARIRSLWAR